MADCWVVPVVPVVPVVALAEGAGEGVAGGFEVVDGAACGAGGGAGVDTLAGAGVEGAAGAAELPAGFYASCQRLSPIEAIDLSYLSEHAYYEALLLDAVIGDSLCVIQNLACILTFSPPP